VTIAVYADGKTRSLSIRGAFSAQTTASGDVAGPAGGHTPCGGQCCGADEGGGAIEDKADKPQGQHADEESSARKGGRGSDEGTSAGEGTQPHTSGDGMHLDSQRDSLWAGAKPCCCMPRMILPTGRASVGWVRGVIVRTANISWCRAVSLCIGSKTKQGQHSCSATSCPAPAKIGFQMTLLHAVGLSGSSAQSGLLPAPEAIGRSPFAAFDGGAEEVSI